MNLRILGAIGAVAALVVAFPAAAYAAPGDPEPTPSYQAREYCRIVANPDSLEAGGTTQIGVVSAPNTDTTLTVVSGSTSITDTKKADETGRVSFSVKLTKAGDYQIDASVPTGESCGLTVKVTAKEKVVDDAEDETTVANATTAVLANTGATTLPYVGAAVVLLGAGAVAVVATKRRRNS